MHLAHFNWCNFMDADDPLLLKSRRQLEQVKLIKFHTRKSESLKTVNNISSI